VTPRPPRPVDDRPAPDLPPGGGLLLVDKPSGCTSHDVVGRLRHVLRTRRIGHAGTLDPMATGLLVLAVDRSTKLLGHLALTDKTYLATIRLGQRTDTDDADGRLIAADPVGAVTDGDIRAGVGALTGPLMQVPSSVSAIKVDGRRAYDRVRAGETVELAARPVTVTRFEILGAPRRVPASGESGSPEVIDLEVAVDCTTGTYVRSLARDLGAALGVGGHLTRLRRTRVGPFTVDAAVDVFGSDRPVTVEFADHIAGRIVPAVDAVRAAFATRTVGGEQVEHLRHGRPVPSVGIPGTYGVLDEAGSLIALVQERGAVARSVLGWLTD
jgi:tRNA pseudouridine55 synthase